MGVKTTKSHHGVGSAAMFSRKFPASPADRFADAGNKQLRLSVFTGKATWRIWTI